MGWGIGVACHIVSVIWPSSSSQTSGSFASLTDEQQMILGQIVQANPGQKLLAIRDVRDRLGLGLKEAKDAVDLYEKLHPEATRLRS
jgi:ribosomal protein L7/L12